MTKEEFKIKWESSDTCGGITMEDVANAYTNWGLGSSPRCQPMNKVLYAVLKAAKTNDFKEYKS